MRRIYILLLMSLWLPLLAAQNVSRSADGEPAEEPGLAVSADSLLADAAAAYAEGRFRQSMQLYEAVAAQYGVSAQLYYNLGNACYKSGEMAPAILYYERALRLDPSDKDIRFNLELCRASVVDRIDPLGEFFFSRWYRQLRSLLPGNVWAWISLAFFWLFLLAVAGFFFAKKRGLKKLSFTVGVISIVFAIFTQLYARQLYHRDTDGGEAIVFAPTVTVKSSPDQSGTELFLLHEGTKVRVRSRLGNWTEIELSDGNVGWLETDNIVVI